MNTFKSHAVELDAAQGQRSYVTFRLLGQTFALPIEPIAQIVEMMRITALPHMPAGIVGIINWHGTLVPALDLAVQLGAADHRPQWRSHVILVEYEGHYVGLIVDEVLDVINLARPQISQPHDIFPAGLSDSVHLIEGLARTPQQLLLLIDLTQLFTRSALNIAELTANLSNDQQPHEPESERQLVLDAAI
jgi:purine-binding chemotaxis protein CheW